MLGRRLRRLRTTSARSPARAMPWRPSAWRCRHGPRIWRRLSRGVSADRDDLAGRLYAANDELYEAVGRHSGLVATRQQLVARIARLEQRLATTTTERAALGVGLRTLSRHARMLDSGRAGHAG